MSPLHGAELLFYDSGPLGVVILSIIGKTGRAGEAVGRIIFCLNITICWCSSL